MIQSHQKNKLVNYITSMKNLLIKLKPFTLLIAISLGFVIFLMFHYIPILNPLKPVAYTISTVMPWIVFLILFLAFCKINYKEMKPHYWQAVLLILQVIISFTLAYLGTGAENKLIKTLLIGCMVCVITPTAAAASVITVKLGGNTGAITTYIIFGNIVAAIAIPIVFSFVNPNIQGNLFEEFLTILLRVFPVIVLPLFLALFLKLFLKKIHDFIASNTKDLGFYLWASIICFLSCKTFSNICKSGCSAFELSAMAFAGLICTVVLYGIGKFVGSFQGQRISAGQGFGQKNMLFGIWVALCYLSPTDAIIPGTYILWQNLFNAYQMYKREKNLLFCMSKGEKPYFE